MNQANQFKTAILIFACSAEAESADKVLSPCQKQKEVALLFEKLNRRITSVAQKTGLPVILVDEQDQTGNTFGHRFAHAAQKVFTLGYKNVITLGNDSPKLTTSLILKAEKALQNGQMPIGPSCDGGFYLLGLSQDNFDFNRFVQFSWQTPKLYHEWLCFASEQKLLAVPLRPLHDIDKLTDISAMASVLLFRLPSLKEVLGVFMTSIQPFSTLTFSRPFQFIQQTFNKGSPVFSS